MSKSSTNSSLSPAGVFAVIEKAVSILGLCRTAAQIKIGLPPLRIYVNSHGKPKSVRLGTLALIERYAKEFDETKARRSMVDVARGRPKRAAKSKPKSAIKSKPRSAVKAKPRSAVKAKSKTKKVMKPEAKPKSRAKSKANGHAEAVKAKKKGVAREPTETVAPAETTPTPPPVLA